jgi:hypothetical protein
MKKSELSLFLKNERQKTKVFANELAKFCHCYHRGPENAARGCKIVIDSVRVPLEDARRPKEAVKVKRRSLDCQQRL